MPWLLGSLASLLIIAIGLMFKSWREVKRSPYFFMRRQAQIKLRQYTTVSIVFVLLGSATAWYGWSPPQDTTPHFAIISNAKPVMATSAVDLNDEPPRVVRIDAPAVAPAAASAVVEQPAAVNALVTASAAPAAQAVGSFVGTLAELPAEYNQYDSQAELTDKTQLGSIAFSREVNDTYEAVRPARIFETGFYTIYATFTYDGMVDGLEWAWVWHHNGQAVSGGTQLWNYGPDGPGYVYYGPEEGFQPGQYTLEIWVNEQLMAESNLIVTAAAASR